MFKPMFRYTQPLDIGFFKLKIVIGEMDAPGTQPVLGLLAGFMNSFQAYIKYLWIAEKECTPKATYPKFN